MNSGEKIAENEVFNEEGYAEFWNYTEAEDNQPITDLWIASIENKQPPKKPVNKSPGNLRRKR